MSLILTSDKIGNDRRLIEPSSEEKRKRSRRGSSMDVHSDLQFDQSRDMPF